jgi:hypothetical protein
MKTILIMCSNGYYFDEFYEFLIRGFQGKYHIILALDRGFWPDKILKKVEGYYQEGVILDYHILKQHQKNEFFKQFQGYRDLLGKLKKQKIDLLVLGEDFIPMSRFLHDQIKKLGGVSVVVGPSNLDNPNFYSAYLKKKELPLENKPAATFTKTKKKSRLIKKGYNFIRYIKLRLTQKKNILLIYKLIPFLLFRKTYSTKYFEYGFSVGYADYVVVIDSVEYDAIKLLVPSVKKLFLAKHVAWDLCKNCNPIKRDKLLVLVSGAVNGVLPERKIKRWISVVKDVKLLKAPTEIHVRFHPREGEELKKQFLTAFQEEGISLVDRDPAQYSIVDGFCDYMGIIGGKSGGLKFVREASREIFVLGIVDGTEDGFHGKATGMGNCEGMHWLNEESIVNETMLETPAFAPNETPRMVDLLIEILETPENLSVQ